MKPSRIAWIFESSMAPVATVSRTRGGYTFRPDLSSAAEIGPSPSSRRREEARVLAKIIATVKTAAMGLGRSIGGRDQAPDRRGPRKPHPGS